MRQLTIKVPENVFEKLNKQVVEDMECLCCLSLKDEFLVFILAAMGRNEPELTFEEK